jgi:Tfp pilus assembly protein PilF
MSVLSHRISLGSGGKTKGSGKMVIAIAAAVVVVAVVAVVGSRVMQSQREAEFKKSYDSGMSAFQTGNTSDAVLRLQKAVSLNPNDSKAHLSLAQAYSSTGKIKGAEQEYLASLKINQNQAEAQYNLGVIYKSNSEFDKALQHLQKAKELNKGLYPADIIMAYVYREMGKPEKAVAIMAGLIKAKPFGANLGDLHAELGLAYQAQGKAALAKAEWQEALKFDKDNAKAKKYLGIK